MKKQLAYFLVCSDNIIFAAGNVALSLNKYMPTKDFDIVIYHTGLRKNNESALKKIPRVTLHRFEFPDNFHEVILPKLPQGRWNNPNSLLTFAHYETFNLLKNYETVIWLDVDTSIQADISELSNYGPFGQCYDINWNDVWTVGDQFTQPLVNSRYDMSRKSYINACIVVNDKLPNWEKMANYCYSKSIEYAHHLKNCDQAIFGLLIQDFKINVNVIPWHDYICHAHHENASIAKIVHFGCRDKVWNDQKFLQTFPEWFRTHMIWLELGGEDFDRTNLSIRSIWNQLYGPNNSSESNYSSMPNNYHSVKKIRNFKIWAFKFLPILKIRSSDNEFLVKLLGITIFKSLYSTEKNRHHYFLFGFPIFSSSSYEFNKNP